MEYPKMDQTPARYAITPGGWTFGKVVFGTFAAVLLGAWVGLSLGLLVTVPLYHWFVPLEKPSN